MLNELLNHPDFRDKVEGMREALTGIVMAEGTTTEKREEALRKYHLIDWLMAELSDH